MIGDFLDFWVDSLACWSGSFDFVSYLVTAIGILLFCLFFVRYIVHV